jgi:transcription initiation factor TFIID subunit 5
MEKHRKDHEMAHSVDLMRLAAIITPQLMQESEYARNLRIVKYNLRICGYAFELMMTFLQDHKFMILLSIINQYVNIKGAFFWCLRGGGWWCS